MSWDVVYALAYAILGTAAAWAGFRLGYYLGGKPRGG